MDVEVRKSTSEKRTGWLNSEESSRCWEMLDHRSKQENEPEVALIELVRRLRSLMAEYQDALLRQSKVLNLDSPPKRSKAVLQTWCSANRPLIGHSFDVSNERTEGNNDLVALRSPPDQDRLTTLLEEHVDFLFSERKEQAGLLSFGYFSEEILARLVAVLSVVISATLLVGAIVALYFAPDYPTKIGFIAMFTLLFAASVELLTNARKAEVYASTAAYAAVLVVFH